MTRHVEEWIGKNDDTAIPDRVKVRVFQAHGGVCHISKRKIMTGEAWDAEHVIAIINGGENRESNLAPALREKHKAKTAQDMAEKAKVYAKRKRHLGVKTKRTITRWRKFNGDIVNAPRDR